MNTANPVHDVSDKKVVLDGFFYFLNCFFCRENIENIISRLSEITKTIEKVLFCPQNRQTTLNNDEKNISTVAKVVAKDRSISSTG